MESWYTLSCASCDKANLVNNGDVSDLTVPDVETFRCWACGVVSRAPEFEGEDTEIADDQERADEDGLPVPGHNGQATSR